METVDLHDEFRVPNTHLKSQCCTSGISVLSYFCVCLLASLFIRDAQFLLLILHNYFFLLF